MAKTSTSAMNRVPPFMPILWQDWESDPDTSTMTDLQVGIFFKMLLRQWVVGSVPANVSDIIRECKLDSGRNTVLRFLETYPHLWPCEGCGADFVRTVCGCSMDAARTSDGQSTDAKRTSGVRRAYTRRINRRLKNLRIDVNSGLELGTTKPNLNKPEPEPELQPTASAEAGSKPHAQQVVQAPPVRPEADIPAPSEPEACPVRLQPEAHPASATPKKDESPAEQAATYLFVILGEPEEHKSKASKWTRLMKEMLDDTGAELADWRDFLKHTFVENVSEDNQPRFTANWMPTMTDPCETLREKFQQWYCWPEWQNTKRVKAKLASKKTEKKAAEPEASAQTNAVINKFLGTGF